MILVVEDEPGILDFVERGLRLNGFEVATATDGVSGLERALQNDVELVVLDMMLPELGGAEVLTSLHAQRPHLPVICLTARAELQDRIAGLDAGAVDYVVKPFSLAELAARVRAHLRTATQEISSVQAGEITIELIGRKVTIAGEQVRLSATEYDLLLFLVQNRPQVLSRAQILRGVWGYDHDPETNIVEVYVGYLRRKLSRPGRRSPIVTVRSVGYRFDEERT
jgi:DNA-binding response OmpR family regulator